MFTFRQKGVGVASKLGRIGLCVSTKGKGGRSAPHSSPPPPPPPVLSSASGRSQHLLRSEDSLKMKGLFKPKPRTPADVVRQTRDLLIFASTDPPDTKESKREDKVPPFLLYAFLTFLSCIRSSENSCHYKLNSIYYNFCCCP